MMFKTLNKHFNLISLQLNRGIRKKTSQAFYRTEGLQLRKQNHPKLTFAYRQMKVKKGVLCSCKVINCLKQIKGYIKI